MVVEGTGQRVAAVEQQSRALHAGRIFAKSSLQDDSLPRAKRAYAELFWRCWLVLGYGSGRQKQGAIEAVVKRCALLGTGVVK